MNASGSIIAWEWEAQAGIWVPYPPKVCQHIESEYRRSIGSVGKVNLSQLGEIELTGCEIHFNRMKQINAYTSEVFKVRRHTYPNTCPFAKGVYWKWWTDVNWQLYDVPTSNYIEDEFQKRSRRTDLRRSPVRIPNFINFSSMEQINRRTKYSRKIQREETKDQCPVANYETPNMLGQCGIGGKQSYNPMQPSTSAIGLSNSTIQPGVGTSTSVLNPMSVRSTAMPNINRNAFVQFASNFGGIMSTTSSGTNTPSNSIGLTMQNTMPLHHIGGKLPVGSTATAFSSHAYVPGLQHGNMNLNNGASNIGVIPQAKSALPVASKSLTSKRKVRSKNSRSPTPKASQSISGPLGNFTRPVECSTDDECAICLESLSTPSEYDNNPTADVQCVSADILQLLQCKHIFHRICLQRLYESGTTQSGCLRCPTCKTIHGVMKGNQPACGTMRVTTNSNDIPGYPGYGSIIIEYNFNSGVQGPNHPNPGQRYSASAFPRTCYLPNNSKGKKVLKLLKIAFDRQLVFTVGRSVTTGQDNTIVWNDIHHKTEGYGNGSGYGYPDPNYLDNVLAELASHGVTDDH